MNAEEEAIAQGDSLPATGRILRLPNSLFLDEQIANETDKGGEKDEMYLTELNEMVEGRHRNQMKPGDICFFNPVLSRRQFGVFIGQAGTQLQYVLESGKWCQVGVDPSVVPTESGFIPQDEAEVIHAALPKQHIVRHGEAQVGRFGAYLGDPPEGVQELCMSVAKRLRSFRNEVLEFRRAHTELLDTLYERISQENDYVRLHFHQFVERLVGRKHANISSATRMAIYLMSDRNPTKIQLYTHPNTRAVDVLLGPRTLVRQSSRVVEWAREYQELAASASKGRNVKHILAKNPVNQFINKARTIIHMSRKLRSPTTIGCLGPSRQIEHNDGKVVKRSSGVSFSQSDVSIIDFVYDTYVRQPNIRQATRHHAIASLILRGIGAYPKMTLESKIGRLLLQELGAMAPWAEPFDDNVVLPIPGRRGAEKFTRQYAEAESLATSLGFKEGSRDIHLPDSLADIRVDLGDMPVYVIDKLETDVHDDGFSLEESKDNPGCYWIHVHIAHPSAFFESDSIFGQTARSQCHSWYTKAQIYTMLPAAVSKSFSLEAGAPTLTTSTLIDQNGKVLDIQVRPTRIHNTISLQPYGVDRLLGMPKQDMSVLVVGSDPSIMPEVPPSVLQREVDNARPHLKVLQKLYNIVQARATMRYSEQKQAISFPFQETVAISETNDREVYRSSRLYESIHYIGDPTIKVVARTERPIHKWHEHVQNRDIVMQTMVLAGESTAKWLADRGLSAVFAGSLTDPEFPVAKLNASTLADSFLTPKATESADPVPHVVMGLAQYTRSTSPLRRYTDLIAQWNINSYLRAEADGVVQNGARLPSTYKVPFTRDAVAEYIQYEGWVAKTGSAQRESSDSHWAFQALFRAFHFNEAELPEIWDAEVRSSKEYSPEAQTDLDMSPIMGTLLPFGHFVGFAKSEGDWEMKATRKQYLPVKIERVDATEGMVIVRAVGPPRDEMSQVGEPGDKFFMSKERMKKMRQAKSNA